MGCGQGKGVVLFRLGGWLYFLEGGRLINKKAKHLPLTEGAALIWDANWICDQVCAAFLFQTKTASVRALYRTKDDPCARGVCVCADAFGCGSLGVLLSPFSLLCGVRSTASSAPVVSGYAPSALRSVAVGRLGMFSSTSRCGFFFHAGWEEAI